MLSRLQFWLLMGCVLVVAGLFALFAAWPRLMALRGEPAISQPVSQASPHAAPAHVTPLPARYFQLSIKGAGTLQHNQVEEKGRAEIELKYLREKTVDGVILTFYSAAMRSFENGKLKLGFEINRDKLIEQSGTQTTELRFEEASPLQQQKLRAAFATNLCRILLDGNQNETGREIFSSLGTTIINDGLLDSTALVHGPYCPGLNRWTATKRVPINAGMILPCSLEYKKTGTDGSQVQVAGSAAKTEVPGEQPSVTLKNISCNLTGREFFDQLSWEYTSAQLTVAYRLDVFENDTLSASLKGELEILLKEVKR